MKRNVQVFFQELLNAKLGNQGLLLQGQIGVLNWHLHVVHNEIIHQSVLTSGSSEELEIILETRKLGRSKTSFRTFS